MKCRSQYQMFPPHPTDRREALEQSLLNHGIEKATIWDDEGNLLDGWERERIADAHAFRCPREVRHFESEADKFRFILAVNAHRRPCLTTTQKRAVIEAYLVGDPEIADNTLAQALGVSKNTVLKARHRLEEAGQVPKVTKTKGKDGKLRPVKYTKRIIANTEKEFEKAKKIVQDLPDECAGKTVDVITAGRRARRNRKRQDQKTRDAGYTAAWPDESIRILRCQFQLLERAAPIQPASANLVLTDIPYQKSFLSQLDELAQLTQRILTDDGMFVSYCGIQCLNEVFRILDKYLTFRWQIASVWEGNANWYHPLNITNNWIPIVVYSKGNGKPHSRLPDVFKTKGKEKEWHEWQKPLEEIMSLVRYFSNPGDMVVDPCGGGFTTAEACLRLNRRCISCDVVAQNVARGHARLQEARRNVELLTGT